MINKYIVVFILIQLLGVSTLCNCINSHQDYLHKIYDPSTTKIVFQNLINKKSQNITELDKLRNSALHGRDFELFVDISIYYYQILALHGLKSFSKNGLINIDLRYREQLNDFSMLKLYLEISQVYYQNYDYRFKTWDPINVYYLNKAKNIAFKSKNPNWVYIFYEKELFAGLEYSMEEFDKIILEASKYNLPQTLINYSKAQRLRAYKRYDESLAYMQKSWAKNGVPEGEIGVCYRNAGKLDSAEFHLLKSFKPYDTSNVITNILIPSINLAKLYLKKLDIKKSKQYLHLADSLANINNKIYHKQEIFEIKIDLFTTLNEKDSLIKVLKEFKKYRMENDDQFMDKNISEMQLLDILELIRNEQNKIRVKYGGIIFLLAGLISLLIINYKKVVKRKQAEKLQLQNDLKIKTTQLYQNLGKIVAIERTQLEKNNIIEKIDKNLILEKNQKLKNLLNDLKEIDNRINTDWPEFKYNLSLIYPDFYNLLLNLNDKLTDLDLKHASYIKLNMSNLEVAQLMGVNVQSVATARFRLKNKLGLPPGQSLRNFIMNLDKE